MKLVQAVPIAVSLPLAVATTESVHAKGLYCKPSPYKIGSYRPDDSEDELDITVTLPIAGPFWFDDVTGDYLPLKQGGPGMRKIARIRVPMPRIPSDIDQLDSLSRLAAFSVAFCQCVGAALGDVPKHD